MLGHHGQTGTGGRGWVLEVFREGERAAKARQPLAGNPYELGSDRQVIWEGAWLNWHKVNHGAFCE